MSDTRSGQDGTGETGWSRREFLRLGGLAGAAGLLASACSSSASPKTTTTSGHPARGGTLRLGVLGGSSADTIEASAPESLPDWSRLAALYSTLLALDPNGNIVPSLAESLESTPDASTYTLRLRPDVEFHNGKTVTTEDVIFSLQRVLSKTLGAAPQLTAVNFNNVTTLDSRTLRFKLDAPSVLFKEGLAAQGSPINIVPVGYNPKAPIGTGPFKYHSFTPAAQSVFVRNPNYFMSGLPYLDTLQIIDYPDADARLNAFLTDELDAIDSVPTAQYAVLRARSGTKLLEAVTGLAIVNYMNTDAPPFNDPRVRLAMKLIVDRPQMIAIAGDGHGSLADDVLGKYFPSYDSSLPQRHQDLGQAKSLLKRAGHSGMTVQLESADFTAGATEQAALLAQYATAAGFTIQINSTTEANLFGTRFAGVNYANSWSFAQDDWSGADYLYQVSLNMGPHATTNETHFSNAKFNALYNEANATADDAKRYELVHEMQVIDFNEGGLIVPYYGTVIDSYSTRFTGFNPAGRTGYSFGDYDFSQVERV